MVDGSRILVPGIHKGDVGCIPESWSFWPGTALAVGILGKEDLCLSVSLCLLHKMEINTHIFLLQVTAALQVHVMAAIASPPRPPAPLWRGLQGSSEDSHRSCPLLQWSAFGYQCTSRNLWENEIKKPVYFCGKKKRKNWNACVNFLKTPSSPYTWISKVPWTKISLSFQLISLEFLMP